MAHYRQLIVQGDTGWHLMNPTSFWEALRLAWLLWKRPERVAALVGVKQEFVLGHLTPIEEKPSATDDIAERPAAHTAVPRHRTQCQGGSCERAPGTENLK